jgi:hypothetical protein
VLFADGGFKCFSCGWAGDRITWLREMEGMSCREAHDHEGLSCSPSCPQYGPCRQGKPTVVPRRRSPQPQRATQRTTTVPVSAEAEAPAPWRCWGEELLAQAITCLAKRPEDIAWLAGRGVSPEAAGVAGLGWMPSDRKIPLARLGLPVADDGKTELWIPGGLLIPIRDRNGRLLRLRVRRTPEAQARFLPERKYQEIKGGGRGPLVIGTGLERPRGVVVVEAELDALAVASACPDVVVIGLTTVAAGLPDWLHRICSAAPVILVALDADQDKDGKPGPGQRAAQRWAATWRQARYWPMPAGKDPGEYVRDHQGNLRAWINEGLPPALSLAKPPVSAVLSPPVVPQPDVALSPACSLVGGKGEAVVYTCTIEGFEVWLTDDQAEWQALAAEGKVVFSTNELARLKVALVGLEGEARRQAVQRVIELKQVFGAAWIRRGAVVQPLEEEKV